MLAGYGFTDLLGILGSLLICSGYFAVSTGRVHGESLPYQFLNAAGAVLLLISLYFRPNPGAILIEAVWLAIALTAIGRILLRR